MARSLDRVLFEAVTRQLDGRGVVVKTGTLVDATVIASASKNKDEEARWVKHRGKSAAHGYKAHVASDEEGGIVRTVEITPANVNNGRMLEAVLPESPGAVYADLAYASAANEARIRAARGCSRLPGRGVWGAEAAGSPAGVEPSGRAGSASDREDLWNLEEELWPAQDALARARQSGAAAARLGHGTEEIASR